MSSADQNPAEARQVAPTMTFSSAVSPPYRPTPCRVLATPRPASRCGLSVVPAAAEQHLAGIGPDEAAQHVQQRGLARPVRADDAQDMPGRDGERDRIKCGQPAETDGHALHFKY